MNQNEGILRVLWWLLMGLHNGAGVLNAYTMIGHMADGDLVLAAVSGFFMLMIASWNVTGTRRE